MTEKEAYVHQWIQEISKNRQELREFVVCPYSSSLKTLIVETTIDDIVPEPGHDVIIFIIEDFWRPNQVKKWVNRYNEKFPYYSFFEDSSKNETFMTGIQTNGQKINLILCQSKIKLSKIRKKIFEVDTYRYWREDYIKKVLGDDYADVEETTE